jgi:hypothetical protein
MNAAVDANVDNPTIKALIEIAAEGWRFARAYSRVIAKLEADEIPRYANQARYFQKKIDDNLQALGLKIVNLEGHRYDIGMAVSAVNMEDFEPDDVLLIDQMIEPIIMGNEGLVRSGTVILSKASQQ